MQNWGRGLEHLHDKEQRGSTFSQTLKERADVLVANLASWIASQSVADPPALDSLRTRASSLCPQFLAWRLEGCAG